MVKQYIPKMGDIVMINFNPTKGHEQQEYRPAIVISNDVFNTYTKMAMVCPISSNIKDFPTHYKLEDSKKIEGSVFTEHIRSIDFTERKIKFVEKASNNDILSVISLLEACIEN
jgi:mRNA interferase MazF